LLLENERDEWELPGGKLELGEDPVDYKRSIADWFAGLGSGQDQALGD
jgi:8-oxo-dGTP pyrophosphatase MutT (NUDIX family)